MPAFAGSKREGKRVYPKPKKDAFGWFITVFVAASIILLIAAVAFGIYVSRGGGSSYGNLQDSDSGPLSLRIEPKGK